MVATFLSVANNASSTLAKAVTAAATEVELVGVTTFPASTPFDVSIDNEILHVTKVTGTVFTVTRGAQGTAAAEHLIGVQCFLNVTAKSVTDLNEAVNTVEALFPIKNANVAAAAGIEESKLSIPEVVKLTGEQSITGLKNFTKVKSTQIEVAKLQFFGETELAGLHSLSLEGSAIESGAFGLEAFERLVIGPKALATLKQIKISGEVAANSTIFSVEPTAAYGIIPEGGATVIESAATQGKHGVIFVANISTTETLTIVHEATGAQKGLATNRFHFASEKNVKLGPGQAVWLWYVEGEPSGAKERWRDLGAWSLWLAAKHAAIANPIEELKSVREKLEEVIAVLKERALTA